MHRPGQALHRDDGHLEGHHGHRARPDRRAADRQQLRVPGALPLLRRHRLSPRDPGLRAPGRRPRGHRPRRSRLPLRRRAAQGRSLRDRLAGHGQRRSRHERQPVLHHQRPRRRRLPPQYSLFGAVVSGGEVVTAIDAVGTDRAARPSRSPSSRSRSRSPTNTAAGATSADSGRELGQPSFGHVAVHEHRRLALPGAAPGAGRVTDRGRCARGSRRSAGPGERAPPSGAAWRRGRPRGRRRTAAPPPSSRRARDRP